MVGPGRSRGLTVGTAGVVTAASEGPVDSSSRVTCQRREGRRGGWPRLGSGAVVMAVPFPAPCGGRRCGLPAGIRVACRSQRGGRTDWHTPSALRSRPCVLLLGGLGGTAQGCVAVLEPAGESEQAPLQSLELSQRQPVHPL